MVTKLFFPAERSGNSMERIQLYAVSVFLLILIASSMAWNILRPSDFVRIILTCATLLGAYVFFQKAFDRSYIATLAIVGCLVVLPLLPYLRYAVYLLGALGCGMLIRYEWKIDKRKLHFFALLLVVIFSTDIYANFQYPNSLALTGAGGVHLDSLFHAAISAMYAHYGVPSIALDGLVPIEYHTLSHKIFAGIATLSGFESLAVYSYIFFVAGPLLFAFSLAGLACQIDPRQRYYDALLGTGVLLFAIMVVPVFGAAALWDSYFISESYLVALLLLFSSLSILLRCAEADDSTPLMPLAASLALLVLAGLSKGSVGLVGICVFGLQGLTRYRNVRYWLLFSAASILLYFGIIDSATSMKQHIPVNPLHFVDTYVSLPFNAPTSVKLIFFLTVHYLSVWTCFAIGLRKSGYQYFKSIEFQVLFALLIPALFFSLTYEIAGGSAYYFSSVPVIVSLAFLLPSICSRLGWVKFKHILWLSVIACLVAYKPIVRKTFVLGLAGYKPDADVVQMVEQLHQIRDGTPKNVMVKIENPELLVDKIGCNAYWYFSAVMERPLVGGLPAKAPCTDYKSGLYGLPDYHGNEKKLVSDNFRVIELKLGRQ